MRRTRQFRPALDTLGARILPSGMLQYINPAASTPASSTSGTLVASTGAITVYAPGPGYATNDPNYLGVVTPAAPGSVNTTTSSQ